jgi:hypothetical protein
VLVLGFFKISFEDDIVLLSSSFVALNVITTCLVCVAFIIVVFTV